MIVITTKTIKKHRHHRGKGKGVKVRLLTWHHGVGVILGSRTRVTVPVIGSCERGQSISMFPPQNHKIIATKPLI